MALYSASALERDTSFFLLLHVTTNKGTIFNNRLSISSSHQRNLNQSIQKYVHVSVHQTFSWTTPDISQNP